MYVPNCSSPLPNPQGKGGTWKIQLLPGYSNWDDHIQKPCIWDLGEEAVLEQGILD